MARRVRRSPPLRHSDPSRRAASRLAAGRAPLETTYVARARILSRNHSDGTAAPRNRSCTSPSSRRRPAGNSPSSRRRPAGSSGRGRCGAEGRGATGHRARGSRATRRAEPRRTLHLSPPNGTRWRRPRRSTSASRAGRDGARDRPAAGRARVLDPPVVCTRGVATAGAAGTTDVAGSVRGASPNTTTRSSTRTSANQRMDSRVRR